MIYYQMVAPSTHFKEDINTNGIIRENPFYALKIIYF